MAKALLGTMINRSVWKPDNDGLQIRQWGSVQSIMIDIMALPTPPTGDCPVTAAGEFEAR